MKKEIVSILIAGTMATGLMACGTSKTVENDGSESATESSAEMPTDNSTESSTEESGTNSDNNATEEETGAAAGSSVANEDISNEGDSATDSINLESSGSGDNGTAAFDEYISSMESITGSVYAVGAKYTNEEIVIDVESDNGNIGYTYANDGMNLITMDYSGDNNTLTIKSLAIDNGEVKEVGEATIEDFIMFCDSCEMRLSQMEFANGKDSIVIETHGIAYTYGDGAHYDINLIEIQDDGSLEAYYDEYLEGSGDEDITSELRASFNDATSSDYTQEEFEAAFYSSDLLAEQTSTPILASVSFTSAAAKFADEGDWDSANQIVSEIYGSEDGTGDYVLWGSGEFY